MSGRGTPTYQHSLDIRNALVAEEKQAGQVIAAKRVVNPKLNSALINVAQGKDGAAAEARRLIAQMSPYEQPDAQVELAKAEKAFHRKTREAQKKALDQRRGAGSRAT